MKTLLCASFINFMLSNMVYILLIIFWASISSSSGQQYYDYSDCSLDPDSYPGSRYTCNSSQKSCLTFLVYRANQQFQTLSNVTDLFQVNPDESNEVLRLNNLTSPSKMLPPGREVLIPINCSCSGQFFQVNFSYAFSGSTTYSDIACSVFESLLKSRTLREENQLQENDLKAGSKLHVPLKCACPDDFSSSKGVKYLVTYPFVEGDTLDLLRMKFGISLEDLCAANLLAPNPTVYPNTTFLIPLKKYPIMNLQITDSQPPSPGFLPTIDIETTGQSKLRTLYVVGSAVGFCLVLVALLVCGLYVKALRKWKVERLLSFNARSSCSIASPRSAQTARSSTNSCLSPDLLVGVTYSLCNYSIDELKRATKGFSEDARIGDQAYKGMIDNVQVMIKQMRFEDTRQVVDVHSKINHINIVSLHGFCYGENVTPWPYIVLELPSNGCLRDCLFNQSNYLRWHKRTQIAFDVATGLHYLHHCIFPTYAHLSVNSRNIFLTTSWRAKLGNVRPLKRNSSISSSVKGWIAPEYLLHGSVSEKVDIFAFGVVLLELLSAREDMDGRLFKDSTGFLGGASEGGCFERLRSFMDPALKQDYPLAEALCLAVLAKACVEDDPLHRPSMDDIMKVLARMV